jgi:hypothetical protein
VKQLRVALIMLAASSLLWESRLVMLSHGQDRALCVCACGAGDRTQGLTNARQIFYF